MLPRSSSHEGFESYTPGSFSTASSDAWTISLLSGGTTPSADEVQIRTGFASLGGHSPNAQALVVRGANGGSPPDPFVFKASRPFTTVDGADPETPIVVLEARVRFEALNGGGSNPPVENGSLHLQMRTPSDDLVGTVMITPDGTSDDFQVLSGSGTVSLGVSAVAGHWYKVRAIYYLADVGPRSAGEFEVRLVDLEEETDVGPRETIASVGPLDFAQSAGSLGELRIVASGDLTNPDFAIDDVRISTATSQGATYGIYQNAAVSPYYDAGTGELDLELAFSEKTHLYLPPGEYELDNPVRIDRTEPLHLHGSGRFTTMLVPSNASQPLFKVDAASHVGLAGMRMHAGSADFAEAIVFQNTLPLRADLQDLQLRPMSMRVQGPGTYVLQQVEIDPLGEWNWALTINDAGAEVYVVGGKIKKSLEENVKVVSGHLEMYGTALNAHGDADVRIDSGSPQGAHIIAGVRSEGSADPENEASRLLQVTGGAVDVLLKGNFLSQNKTPSPGAFAHYAGSGTLWLLGNLGRQSVHHLIDGAASGTVIALGNGLEGGVSGGAPGDLFPDVNPAVADLIYAFNLYKCAPSCSEPTRRFVNPGRSIEDAFDGHPTPDVPTTAYPGGGTPLLERPVMDSPPSELIVSVATYLDVSDSVQDALDDTGANLYFPPGRYEITGAPLYYHHPDQGDGTLDLGAGGWFAGSGSDESVIVRTDAGEVFATEGMNLVTLQGLTFEARSWQPPATGFAAFDLGDREEDNGNSSVLGGHRRATQSNSFDDVRFVGGRYGLGIALRSHQMGAETLCARCVFYDSHIGMASGGANALSNAVHGGTFREVDLAVAPGEEVDPADPDNRFNKGINHIFGAEALEMGIAAFAPSRRTNYISKLWTDAPVLSDTGCHASLHAVMLDGLTLDPVTPADPVLKSGHGGSYTILQSELFPSGIGTPEPDVDLAGCTKGARGFLFVGTDASTDGVDEGSVSAADVYPPGP